MAPCPQPAATWTPASGQDGFYDLAEAQAYCGSLALDGAGFRLPTLAELLTLVDASAGEEPLIDLTAFPDTVATQYWSSTDYRHFGQTAGVSFANGSVAHDDPDGSMRVRCVRCSPPKAAAPCAPAPCTRATGASPAPMN